MNFVKSRGQNPKLTKFFSLDVVISCDDPELPPSYSKLRLALGRAALKDYQDNLGHFHNQHDTVSAIREGAELAGLKRQVVFITGLVAYFAFKKQ